MIETQALPIENLDEGEPVNFTPSEWKHFVSDVKDMLDHGKFDLIQAVNNARYLTMLDKCFKQLEQEKVVTFTDKEWEDFVNAQELYRSWV